MRISDWSSDVCSYDLQFEANFGACWQGRLEQTYRCNQLLADTAARFVQRNPAQITKTVRSTRAGIPRSIRVIPVTVEWRKPSFPAACFQLLRSEEHTSELQSLMRTSYAVFCLKKNTKN